MRRFRKIQLLLLLQCLSILTAGAQQPDSVSTGFLTDAAEEYWIKTSPRINAGPNHLWKHLPVRQNKGYVGFGLSNREQYEYFRNYLWGAGVQDNNGYLLHRLLATAQLQWNRHLRIFTELQGSFISGRNGGPRPVQDLNRLAVNQVFGELNLRSGLGTSWRLRVGKQALHYGRGTLLDVRDINVRRSFAGVKGIFERRQLRADFFWMTPVQVQTGAFDDQRDGTQQIAGLWVSHEKTGHTTIRTEGYLLHTRRNKTQYHQGKGREERNTLGGALTFRHKGWNGYTELDGQWGRWQNKSISAWKAAQALGFQFSHLPLKPQLTMQVALSSGDRDSGNHTLQTFHPLYPRAVYYGFLENVGSSNVLLVHPKLDVQISKGVAISTGYYRFWRQSLQDGLYAGNGAYLFPAVGNNKRIGSMWDLSVLLAYGHHWQLAGTAAFYKRGPFLLKSAPTAGDISYVGLRSLLRF